MANRCMLRAWCIRAGFVLGVSVVGMLCLADSREAHGAPQVRFGPGIHQGVLQVGELERRYQVYVPRRAQAPAPLVVLLHGSRQTAQRMRKVTGFAFEHLAEQHGFVALYPEAHRKRWNDCRAAGRYPARRRDVDDVGFVVALADSLRLSANVDLSRVFLAGYSSGAQLAFRVALERPERVAGIAAFAASLPSDENWGCKASGKPVAALLVNGTDDRINPFEGGEVDVFGFASRGTVRSSQASAEYFARLAGASALERERSGTTPDSRVERFRWAAPGAPEVMLLAVHGGGHVIPGPRADFPALLGKVSPALDGPAEAWRFFSRQEKQAQ